MARPTAGERTEKPSAKKLKDARERGQVARSRDLSAAMSLAAATLALGWFGDVDASPPWPMQLATGLSSSPTTRTRPSRPEPSSACCWSDARPAGADRRGRRPSSPAWSRSSSAWRRWAWRSRRRPSSSTGVASARRTGLGRLKPMHAGRSCSRPCSAWSWSARSATRSCTSSTSRRPASWACRRPNRPRVAWDRVVDAALAMRVWRCRRSPRPTTAYQRWQWYSGLKMTQQEVIDESKSERRASRSQGAASGGSSARWPGNRMLHGGRDGDGRGHQPDTLRRRAGISPRRDGRAACRGQGRGPYGGAYPRDRARARACPSSRTSPWRAPSTRCRGRRCHSGRPVWRGRRGAGLPRPLKRLML